MKRKLSIFLPLMLILALAFSMGVQAQPDIVTGPGELPIVTEPVTLKVVVRQTTGVSDYEENAFTKWAEEQTGIRLEVEVVPNADAQAKLNVILASNELPDVLINMPFTAAQLAQTGADGLLYPMNDLMEQYGFETKRIFEEERPHYLPLITSPDGNIYGLPEINECFHCFASQKMWVYGPWLEALGLDLPTTTDEFRDMLIAFRDNDPNGNGEADEIPLTGNARGTGWHNAIDEFLMNSFLFYDFIQHERLLLDENKQVQAAYAQDAYKEGLKYLNSLYEEGLIDPAAFVQDNDQLKIIGNNPGVNIIGAVGGGWQGMFTQVLSTDEGGYLEDWVALPPLEGPDGYRGIAYAPWGLTYGKYVISADTEYPEAAFRFADFMYNIEATTRSVFGELGVDWVWAEEGELGLDGGQALYRNLSDWGEDLQAQSWNQAMVNYRTSEYRLAQADDGNQYIEVSLLQATRDKMMSAAPDVSELIPPLVFGVDDSRELNDLQLALETYVDEMMVQFITGQIPIEDAWGEYLDTLEAIGLPRYLEIYQTAYDAAVS